MRKNRFLPVFVFAVVAVSNHLTYGALEDQGGGLIYDTVLDITWLQDMNHADTTGHDDSLYGSDTDGTMFWVDAVAWAEDLVYAGRSDWRLPLTPVACNGPGPCTSSEMGQLYWTDEITSASPGLFSNVRPGAYWSGSTEADVPWYFPFSDGSQGTDDQNPRFYAVAVHPGKVVPQVDSNGDGSLDLTFGIGGKVTTVVGSGKDESFSVAVQDDGKIVLGGYTNNGSDNDFAVARYTANGSLDTSFGIGGAGKVNTAISGFDDIGTGVAIQDDGKILLAGISNNGSDNDFTVVRYNADGSLDTDFGTGGIALTDIDNDIGNSVAIQTDGKIVIGGYSNISGSDEFTLIRYNTDGSLDTGFRGTGKYTIIEGGDDIGYSVAVQSDGRILLAGYSNNGSDDDFSVVRVTSNGFVDTDFGVFGKAVTPISSEDDQAYKVLIQGDGKIVLTGSSGNGSNRDFAVVRYNADGSLDTSFGNGGIVVTPISSDDDWGLRAELQPDGKIVMTGRSFNGTINDLTVVRYNTDGSLDTSFGSNGIVTTSLGEGDSIGHSVALQIDGKIVVAAGGEVGGDQDFAAVRFLSTLSDSDNDGIPDVYETDTGIYISPTDTGTSPTNPDSDGDNIIDGDEVGITLDPNVDDTPTLIYFGAHPELYLDLVTATEGVHPEIIITRDESGEFIVKLRIEITENLEDWISMDLTGAIIDGDTVTITIPVSEASEFLRIIGSK